MLAFGLPVINGIIAGIIAIPFGIVIVTFSCNYLIGMFMLIVGADWIAAAACSPVYSGNWALLRMVLRER